MAKIMQIVGYKNFGKTTVVEELVRFFSTQGFKVGTIKHDAHDFKMDYPNTDTWRHRESGASITAITSPKQTAIIEQKTKDLQEIVKQMLDMDIIFVEGFKGESYPKIVILKSDEDLELVKNLNNVVACIIWDFNITVDKPTFSLKDKSEICEWVKEYFSF